MLVDPVFEQMYLDSVTIAPKKIVTGVFWCVDIYQMMPLSEKREWQYDNEAVSRSLSELNKRRVKLNGILTNLDDFIKTMVPILEKSEYTFCVGISKMPEPYYVVLNKKSAKIKSLSNQFLSEAYADPDPLGVDFLEVPGPSLDS